MAKGMVFVEGHGEVEAVGNLVFRLWKHLELDPAMNWLRPRRQPNIHLKKGIVAAMEQARQAAPDVVLVLRDDEDGCPAQSGPESAAWIRDLALPFPVAAVMAYREFETWFFPSLHRMSGRPIVGVAGSRGGLASDVVAPEHPESIRGVKEWLSNHYDGAHSYKPSLDQLPLTRMIDPADLVSAGALPNDVSGAVSSAGTLVRSLEFLAANMGSPGLVYPNASQ